MNQIRSELTLSNETFSDGAGMRINGLMNKHSLMSNQLDKMSKELSVKNKRIGELEQTVMDLRSEMVVLKNTVFAMNSVRPTLAHPVLVPDNELLQSNLVVSKDDDISLTGLSTIPKRSESKRNKNELFKGSLVSTDNNEPPSNNKATPTVFTTSTKRLITPSP